MKITPKKTPTMKIKKTVTVVNLDRKMTETRLKASYHDTNKLTVLVSVNVTDLILRYSSSGSPLGYICHKIKERLPAGKSLLVDKFRMEEVSLNKQTIKFKVTVQVTDDNNPATTKMDWNEVELAPPLGTTTMYHAEPEKSIVTSVEVQPNVTVASEPIKIVAEIFVVAEDGEDPSGLPYDFFHVERWFESVPATSVVALANAQWKGTADRNNKENSLAVGIANYMANYDADVSNFMSHNSLRKFEVKIDPNQAMDWLEKNAETQFRDPVMLGEFKNGAEIIAEVIRINKENISKPVDEQI